MNVLPTVHCNELTSSSYTIPAASDCYEVKTCMVFLALSKQILSSVITLFPNESRPFALVGQSVFYDINPYPANVEYRVSS
jgi:hypothetical protein